MKNSRTGSASRDHARADDQHIHPGPQKAVEGFVRRAHDGLVFIKRGVQYHRNSCDIFEFLDESPIERLGPPAHRLKATSAVHMRWSGNHHPFLRSHRVSHGHKRRRFGRSEEHTSELQSRGHLVCRLLLEKKKKKKNTIYKYKTTLKN